jgi:hypothetical protein
MARVKCKIMIHNTDPFIAKGGDTSGAGDDDDGSHVIYIAKTQIT